jgi:integrase
MNALAKPASPVSFTGIADFAAWLEGNPTMTGAGSRFADERWDLSFEMRSTRGPPCDKRLDFRMNGPRQGAAKYTFPDGKGLADYPCFHDHAKRLLAAMLFCPRNKLGPTYSPKTITNTLRRLRRVYCGLVKEGWGSFESVPHAVFANAMKSAESGWRPCVTTFGIMHLYGDLVPAFTFDSGPIMREVLAARHREENPDDRGTEPIPDEVFRQLLRVCLDYVQERAATILNARDALAALDSLPCIDSSSVEAAGAVSTACRNLNYAAVVLLFALTGMRLNELFTIRPGCVKRDRDGTIDRTWIESVHTKFAESASGDTARWLCGSVGAQAVAVLTRLSEPTRRKSRTEYLIGPLVGTAAIKWTGESATRYQGGSAPGFFASTSWWSRFLRDHNIVGTDGRPTHIHSHQFRRTFARWCALADSGTGLLALKDHFKHASILMTRHYARIDDELRILFELEKDRIRAESFDKVLRAEALGGVGGHLIKQKIDTAIGNGDLPREFRGLAGARLRADCIKNWLQSGIQLRPCAGHYCVPIDPHGACGEANSVGCNKGTCRNAVFHPEHAPGLAEKIRNDRRTLEKMTAWSPTSAHVQELSTHIHVQEKILGDITLPKHETKTHERA